LGAAAAVKPQRAKKMEAVAGMAARLRAAPAAVLVDFRGLRVAEESELRRLLREARVEYRVVKNTLARRAAREAGIEGLDPLLVGPTALAFSAVEAPDAARVLVGFARDHPALRFKGGVLAGRVLAEADVRTLAEMPSREVLLGRVASALVAPLGALAAVLAAPVRSLLVATRELARQREAAGNQAGSGPEASREPA
jgi:large subunit ribosomal protein L10